MRIPTWVVDGWRGSAEFLLGLSCWGCAEPGYLLCPRCRQVSTGAPRMIGMLGRDCPVWVTGDYRKPLSNLIVAHKDRGAWGLVNHLAALQAQAIRATRPPSSAVVVPVPSAVRAVRVRGYDHGWEIARRAARAVGLSARRELVRTREVVDQAALSRAGRLLAQDHSMAVRPGWFAPVIITDDVITTGATIREALRAYQAGGRKVAAIVAICRTVRHK